MTRLAREITAHVVIEYGPDDMLQRLSDPFWFQALGCVLGFDWHSSGVTTTTCGAIKEGIKEIQNDLGFFAAGGKGGTSRKTPQEIETICEHLGLAPESLVYASKTSAKVDSACVQDSYQLYHHAFFFTTSGRWCVVQQGMNDENRMARRYHWLGEKVDDFVDEPHAAICCDHRGKPLNLVAEESESTRNASAELAIQSTEKTLSLIQRLPDLRLPSRHPVLIEDVNPAYLKKILLTTYERQPKTFEELLVIRGVGAKTLRALALVSELVYGARACVRDPARFSFAHGGKDGYPYPVDKKTYDTTIDILHRALERAKVDHTDKVKAFRRLAAFVAPDQKPNRQKRTRCRK
jgi:hypothetical protein